MTKEEWELAMDRTEMERRIWRAWGEIQTNQDLVGDGVLRRGDGESGWDEEKNKYYT